MAKLVVGGYHYTYIDLVFIVPVLSHLWILTHLKNSLGNYPYTVITGLTCLGGHMEKQEMEMKWKLETETGN